MSINTTTLASDNFFGPESTGTIEMQRITADGLRQIYSLDGRIRNKVINSFLHPVHRKRCTQVLAFAFPKVMHYYIGNSIRVWFRLDQDGPTVLGAGFHAKFDHFADSGAGVASTSRLVIKDTFQKSGEKKPSSNPALPQSNGKSALPPASDDAPEKLWDRLQAAIEKGRTKCLSEAKAAAKPERARLGRLEKVLSEVQTSVVVRLDALEHTAAGAKVNLLVKEQVSALADDQVELRGLISEIQRSVREQEASARVSAAAVNKRFDRLNATLQRSSAASSQAEANMQKEIAKLNSHLESMTKRLESLERKNVEVRSSNSRHYRLWPETIVETLRGLGMLLRLRLRRVM